ncbi:MAG: hypothetical protein LAQ30_02840, partial [Acidobacteriia bacterium]|nr:hypothetical protein [Terriglobia bacterium]
MRVRARGLPAILRGPATRSCPRGGVRKQREAGGEAGAKGTQECLFAPGLNILRLERNAAETVGGPEYP